LDHDPVLFLKLINFLRMVDQKSRTDLHVPVPAADFQFCWLLEYYGLMLAVFPPHWCITHGENGAIIQNPICPNGPFVLTATPQSTFALKIGQKPDICASLLVVFEKGSTGKIGWFTHIRDGLTAHHLGNITADIARSEKDQRVKLQCTFQVKTSTYLYSVKVENLDPIFMTSNLQMRNDRYGPYIILSGTVVVSDMLYRYD
jgi:hypothetical protein